MSNSQFKPAGYVPLSPFAIKSSVELCANSGPADRYKQISGNALVMHQ